MTGEKRKERKLIMKRGKIKIIDENKLEIVTVLDSYVNDGSGDHEETIDRFTFDEIREYLDENDRR